MVSGLVEKMRIRGVGPLLFCILEIRVCGILASVMASEMVVVSMSGVMPEATTFDSLRTFRFRELELVAGLKVFRW